MTDPKEIAAQAFADSKDPRARRRTRWLGIAALVLLLLTAGIGGYAIRSATEGEQEAAQTARQARQTAAQAEADRRAALAAIGQECSTGTLPRELRFLCDQVRQIREAPPPPVQGTEIQEREVQQPEIDQPERQQTERQDREIQEREAQDRDPNDLESQDEERQDAEEQEPEVQEPEQQDPEVDDPDPNSALTFAVEDNCQPTEGQFVTDVGATWRREAGTLTLVLTCTTADLPPPPPSQQ